MRKTAGQNVLKITESSERTAASVLINKHEQQEILRDETRRKQLLADRYCPENCTYQGCVWTAKVKVGNRMKLQTERRYLCERGEE